MFSLTEQAFCLTDFFLALLHAENAIESLHHFVFGEIFTDQFKSLVNVPAGLRLVAPHYVFEVVVIPFDLPRDSDPPPQVKAKEFHLFENLLGSSHIAILSGTLHIFFKKAEGIQAVFVTLVAYNDLQQPGSFCPDSSPGVSAPTG